MEHLNEYTIPFKGLKEGKHVYQYEIDNKFFAEFEESEVKEGKVSVKVELDKKPSFLLLTFNIKGTISVVCDRCLEYFDQSVKTKSQLIVKFTDEEYEEGDDVIFLSPTAYQLNVAQYIYEFIILAIPIQRIHPVDKEGKSMCDPEMVRKLQQYISNGNESGDSPWNELKKLFDN
ncbi:MAG: DUF177 domain-containing protein [Bacteroidota bacterium]|nr:DUF177 domain-containing protein [Bacteroidota bacterium]